MAAIYSCIRRKLVKPTKEQLLEIYEMFFCQSVFQWCVFIHTFISTEEDTSTFIFAMTKLHQHLDIFICTY